jgi:benzoyl-CoA-dihydrodiol lyase
MSVSNTPVSPAAGAGAKVPSSFESHPSRYRHWKLSIEGQVARLDMAVREDEPLLPGYPLKLNSYDLGVDIELCDAVQRLRFEQPQVRVVILGSGRDRVFCAGANIHMLASSTHGFKVNFCKYTNETRLSIEDASRNSGQKYLAAVSGPCAGGGYELAMACDEILLIDDGSSTVSLPEVPLLGVLPGTGGLTRLLDKRRVRRDRADVFSTLAEGIRGKRAVEWRLVDEIAPRSRFAQAVQARAQRLLAGAKAAPTSPGIELEPLLPEVSESGVRYRHVELKIDRGSRLATLTVRAPSGSEQWPSNVEDLHAKARAGNLWALRAFRELDDAILRLRFHESQVGLVLLRTEGEIENIRRADAALWALRQDWLAREIVCLMARVLRRLDQTSKSLFAVAEPGSCFAGSLLEILLAADRSYVLDDPAAPTQFAASALNDGALPVLDGRSRLDVRFYGDRDRVAAVLAGQDAAPLSAQDADELGLCTVLADDIDFADTLRLAIEERVSLSPDALTGMEQNLRAAACGEGMEQRIFGRLSAWQNWIFIRPNATGERGALSSYGKPERPIFDWTRT